MTLREVSNFLGISENTLFHNFAREKERLASKGISLEKEGYGLYKQYSVYDLTPNAIVKYRRKKRLISLYEYKEIVGDDEEQEQQEETWTTEEVANAFDITIEEARKMLIASWIDNLHEPKKV